MVVPFTGCVVVAAIGFAECGDEIEKPHHGEAEPAGECDGAEVRSKVFHDAAGVVEIEDARSPEQDGEGEKDAAERRVHGGDGGGHGITAFPIHISQATATIQMTVKSATARPRMNFFRITVW